MRSLAPLLAALAIALPSSAQSVERFLVPYYVPDPIPGGYGSQWVSELVLLNAGDTPVGIEKYEQPCPLPTCATGYTPPGVTFYPVVRLRNVLDGLFLRVAAARADDVLLQLRARDLSRQSQDWGTEIPTMRESMAPIGAFNLLDVPTDPRYRVMLRLYHFANGEVQATVRFFATPTRITDPAAAGVEPDLLLAEETVTFTIGSDSRPGYAELATLLERFPVLAQSERIRIQVATDPSIRLWGFATITNNDTQHVTVISAR